VLLSGFPRPYPDELLFSTLCRFWSRTGWSAAHFKRALRQTRGQLPLFQNPFFPVPIRTLLTLLPASFLTPEQIIENHSVLPFYRPFATPHAYKALLFRSNEPSSRTLSNFLRDPVLRFCPQCVNEDKQAMRQPYLRTFHQIVGCEICVAHRLRLLSLPSTATSGYLFSDLRLEDLPPAQPIRVSANLEILAEDLKAIPSVYRNIKPTQFWNAVRLRLGKTGSGRKTLPHDREEILRRLTEIPGLDSTELYNASIRPHLLHFQPWVAAYAMIIIRVLNESPQSFASTMGSGASGTPTRPCRNRNCRVYKKVVIPEVRFPLPGTGYFLFSCPECRFTYALTFAQITNNAPNPDLRIYSLGNQMDAFRGLWEDPRVEVPAILTRFHISETQLYHLLQLQGMSCAKVTERAEFQSFQRRHKKDQEDRLRDREILLDAFACDPRLICRTGEKGDPLALARIRARRNEPEWFRDLVRQAAQAVRRISKEGRAADEVNQSGVRKPNM
jgi:hypothetical protein